MRTIKRDSVHVVYLNDLLGHIATQANEATTGPLRALGFALVNGWVLYREAKAANCGSVFLS